MNKADLEKHVKILGWVHIVSGALFLLFGLGMGAFMLFTGVLTNDEEAFAIFTIVALFVTGLLTVIGLPGIIGGFGLLKRKNWGRILTLIVGLLNITNVPVGTAIGAYTAYVLLQDSAKTYFE